MQKYKVYLCDDYKVKSSGFDVLLLANACMTHHEERFQQQVTCDTQYKVTDCAPGHGKYDALNKVTVLNSKSTDHHDRSSANNLSNTTPQCRKKSFFTYINSYS